MNGSHARNPGIVARSPKMLGILLRSTPRCPQDRLLRDAGHHQRALARLPPLPDRNVELALRQPSDITSSDRANSGQRSLPVGSDALYEGMRTRCGREPGDGFSKLRPVPFRRGRLLRSRVPLIAAGFPEFAATANPEQRASLHLSSGSSLRPSGRITGSCVTFALTTEVSSSHNCLAALPRAGE
jgi:hypothetical protein